MTVAHPPAIRSIFHERHAYWRQLAACRHVDTDVFYPSAGRGSVDEARAVCEHCPVAEQCLDFALRTRQHDGVWAGRTDKDLRKLRREMRAAS